tara:strand:+ start:49 stop:579 length:531 start_codon:yes stop_codon:yes gene_type:complete
MNKLQLFKWLSEQQHKTIMESKKVNDEIMKSMAGTAGERMISKLVTGRIVARDGYDIVAEDDTKLSNGITIKDGDRIEVKTCVTHTGGENTAYSLSGKEEYADFIALVDLRDGPDEVMISIIPTDVFFADGLFMANNERFAWSGTYNKSDDQRIKNTNLFLKYKIANNVVKISEAA